MTPELEQKIYDRYPKLFQQKDFTIQQSCMPWGIECEDGWYDLIVELCEKIKNIPVSFSQMKEKLGWLAAYMQPEEGCTDEQVKFLMNVEMEYLDKSLTVCEVCGKDGEICHRGTWLKTLCPKHREELEYDIEDPPDDLP